jgi:hypothetical protein
VNDWADRAARLAEELVAAGKLHSPEWIAAVRAIPRHELVGVYYEHDPGTGGWLTRDATDPIWQERIYATCSVPAIPRAWLDQTRIGGLILADLKLSVHAGNLVLLTRLADRAEGRFDRTWAGFMALRPNTPATAAPTVAGQQVTHDRAQVRPRTTDLGQLRPWDNLLTWFLAQLTVPGEIGYGHALNGEHPEDVFLTSADGSWCEVSNHADNGTRQVWEAGPTALWRAVENADRRWRELGQPGWDRFGLTATTEQQWIWLDSPNSEHTWLLPK